MSLAVLGRDRPGDYDMLLARDYRGVDARELGQHSWSELLAAVRREVNGSVYVADFLR